MSRLHDKLTALREERGVSVRVIASLIEGASETTVGRWFNGKSEPTLREAAWLANFFSVPIDYLADDSLDDPNESAMSIQEHAIQVVLKKRGIKDVFLLDSDLRTRDLEPEKFKEHMKDLWADFQNIQLHLLMSEMRRTKDFRQPIIKVTPENDRTGDSSSVSSDSAAVPVRYRRLLLPKTPSPPEDEGKPRSSSLHPAPPNEPPKDASQQEQFHKAPLAILKGGKRPEGEDSAAPKKNKPASKK